MLRREVGLARLELTRMPRQAKVGEPSVALAVEQDVGRLDVPAERDSDRV